jgi:hypothetical protein
MKDPRRSMSRRASHAVRLTTAGVVVSLLLSAMSPTALAATNWIRYKTTSSALATYPSKNVSSSSWNQSIEAADLDTCNSGTWTKYIDISISSHVLHYYSGTSCLSVSPHPGVSDTNAKSGCASQTSGTFFAQCWRFS